jgi:hypothetical protein
MQTLEQLSPTDAQGILDRLPERIRTALVDDLWSVVDHRARHRNGHSQLPRHRSPRQHPTANQGADNSSDLPSDNGHTVI